MRHHNHGVAVMVVMMVMMPMPPAHYERCGVMMVMMMADLNADLGHLLRRWPPREPRVVGLQQRQRIRDRIEQIPVVRRRRKPRRLRGHRLHLTRCLRNRVQAKHQQQVDQNRLKNTRIRGNREIFQEKQGGD